jgi:hypothetical protein
MLGALPGQVNESHGVGGGSRGWLAINLSVSTLSTSAPAPSVQVDAKASRRSTCDRGIWTMSLAFAAEPNGLSLQFLWTRKRI